MKRCVMRAWAKGCCQLMCMCVFRVCVWGEMCIRHIKFHSGGPLTLHVEFDLRAVVQRLTAVGSAVGQGEVAHSQAPSAAARSEERRVGQECRSRWVPDQ